MIRKLGQCVVDMGRKMEKKTINEHIVKLDSNDIDWDREFNQDEQQILRGINQKVAQEYTLDDILNYIFDETHRVMPLDRLDAAFVEDEGARLVLYYVKTSYEPVYLVKGYASDISGGSVQNVFRSGYPSVISDLEVHYQQNPKSESARLLVQEGIHSSMACPLKVNNRDVAILIFRSKDIDAYSLHEIKLMLSFRDRLAQAVEKAYQVERLQSSMDSYMEMLGFVSHELKNPLASIITMAKTMASGYFEDIGEKNKEMLNRLVRKAEYLHNLAQEYLNLARFETGEFSINPVDVDFQSDVIDPSIDLVQTSIDENKMKLDTDYDDTSMKVRCDPELMKIVMVNLVNNAAKYGKPEGRILVKMDESERVIRVSVWNEGPGFPESEKIRLFRKFSRVHTPELMERDGHGVGLYVTWKIIQLHGGHIWALSEYGKWAEFCFEIPVRMDQCLINPSELFN